MEDKGLREFQQRRTEIMINIINKSCDTLLKKGINISVKSVTEEVTKNFKKENIDKKYLVSSQTIGRDIKYNKIWKTFQKKQKGNFITKYDKKNTEVEFTIRDKYDMLKQDYIELKDQYTYVIQENTKYIETIKSYNNDYLIENTNLIQKPDNQLAIELLTYIKELLRNGSVIIVEKDNKTIIKNMNIKDDNKIIIDKNKWDSI